MAERAAAAVAPSLERIGAAEVKAAQTYRGSVEAQLGADATPIPKLSAHAEAAVASLATAPGEKARAALWNSITADTKIGAELRRFSEAVRQRFGDDTLRAMLGAEGQLIKAASVPRQHYAALATVSRTIHTLKQGEWASARQAKTARLAQRQALGYCGAETMSGRRVDAGRASCSQGETYNESQRNKLALPPYILFRHHRSELIPQCADWTLRAALLAADVAGQALSIGNQRRMVTLIEPGTRS